MHAIEDALNHFFGGALDVGVFNAKYKHPAVLAREEPIEQRRASTAKVKIARW